VDRSHDSPERRPRQPSWIRDDDDLGAAALGEGLPVGGHAPRPSGRPTTPPSWRRRRTGRSRAPPRDSNARATRSRGRARWTAQVAATSRYGSNGATGAEQNREELPAPCEQNHEEHKTSKGTSIRTRPIEARRGARAAGQRVARDAEYFVPLIPSNTARPGHGARGRGNPEPKEPTLTENSGAEASRASPPQPEMRVKKAARATRSESSCPRP